MDTKKIIIGITILFVSLGGWYFYEKDKNEKLLEECLSRAQIVGYTTSPEGRIVADIERSEMKADICFKRYK